MVFSCGKTRSICTFQILKEISPSPRGWRLCFCPLFLGRNCEMSFHALSCFPVNTMKPACLTGEDVVNKVVAFDSVSFLQLWGNFYFAELFAAPSAKKKKKESHRLRDHSVPYCSLRCRFSDLCRWSLMSSTVVVLLLCVGAVRGLTLRGWLAKFLFHLKALRPTSDNDRVRSIVSIFTQKYCCGGSALTRNSITASFRKDMSSAASCSRRSTTTWEKMV
jgi:hypothetical protein